MLPPVALAGSPGVLPNGTYTYAIFDSGKRVETSTIVVTRSPGGVVVSERGSPMQPGYTTRRTLDATSFATTLYELVVTGKTMYSITVDKNVATVHEEIGPQSFSAPAGSRVAIFDAGVAPLFHLPATLREDSSPVALLTTIMGYKFEPLVLAGEPGPRPQNVPASDAATAVTIEDAVGTLWYDPQTLVLDEFDLPSRRFVFRRI